MIIKEFENLRWGFGDQKPVSRHLLGFDLINNGSVLDVGCGDGLFLDMLRVKGVSKLFGLDISNVAVEKCRQKKIEAILCDFSKEKLPFENNCFDNVVMLDVLEHVFDPKELLLEAKRVSNKNIVISIPNFNSLAQRVQVLLGNIPENNRKNKGHVYWFNLKEVKRIIKECDLEIEYLKMNTYWDNISVVGFITKFLLRAFPSSFALSFCIKLKKNE